MGPLRTLVCAFAVACTPLVPQPASTEEAPDWLLLRVTAGLEGARDVRVGGSLLAVETGEEIAVMGFGSGNGRFAHISVNAPSGGPFEITTTSGAGGARVTVLPADPPGATGLGFAAFRAAMGPGEVYGVLVFQTASRLERVDISDPEVGGGSVIQEIVTGRGSRPLRAADPSDEGVALAVGPAAAGTSGHEHNPDRGIAGGFVWNSEYCLGCIGSWKSPDGVEGSWRSVGAVSASAGSGELTFAGPAGPWSWSWTGLAMHHPCTFARTAAFGAWVPVGDHWPLFRTGAVGASSTLICLI